MIVFLDTNIVIYRIEMPAGFGPRTQKHIADLGAAGHTFAVSDLVRMEARVIPIRNSNQALLALYDAFFSAADVQLFPFTTAVFDRATLLRADHNFKTADALQLAVAVVHGCDRFLTADARLQRCTDITVDLLP